MSSKEQKTPEGKPRKKLSRISTKRLRQLSARSFWAEQVDPRDEKIANLEAQLAEAPDP